MIWVGAMKLSPRMDLPLVEKYRPKSLFEIYGNKEVIRALCSISESNKVPHMLLYGPSGTGKTTAARAISGYFPKSCVLELNASDERGISTVRNVIKGFASAYSGVMKLVILDEVDMMSRDAQNALRRIMEDFSRGTRFCLIANYHRKIILPILSRCTKFKFGPVCNVRARLVDVCKMEGIKYTEDGIDAVSKYSDGDLRKAINDIQGIATSFGVVDLGNTCRFGNIVPKEVYEKIFDDFRTLTMSDIEKKLQILICEYKIDCGNLIKNLCELVRNSGMESKMKILKELSDVEYRVSMGCCEDILLYAVISTFLLNRD